MGKRVCVYRSVYTNTYDIYVYLCIIYISYIKIDKIYKDIHIYLWILAYFGIYRKIIACIYQSQYSKVFKHRKYLVHSTSSTMTGELDGGMAFYFPERKNNLKQSPRICLTFWLCQKVECKKEIGQDTLTNPRVTGLLMKPPILLGRHQKQRHQPRSTERSSKNTTEQRSLSLCPRTPF